ncbi:MAG: site-2 protease family protein [Pirellulales bacterium]|nr:site-2 protease family protein [Pirellulales bacterium]
MSAALVAAFDVSGYGPYAWGILQAAIGLGFVIFVHELGHFAVAKMCGVKCEKFFIGFDIGGYKISRKWGETEYGIGILPLGGYVKMLGQDDNPANYAEQVRESQAHGSPADAKEVVGPDGQKFLVDRRSYMAKSVPQRMAIISAGVVMNVIFAFIFAVVAYGLGVPYMPAEVSQTAPGSPAWRAGILPGDEIVRIGDIEQPSYNELQGAVTLADLDAGVPMVLRRGEKEFAETLKPEAGVSGGLVRIGVVSPRSLKLAAEMPARPGSAASEASPALVGGDEIIAVDGQPIADFAAFAAIAVQRPGETLHLTVRRQPSKEDADKAGDARGDESESSTREVETSLPPQAAVEFGLSMEMGQIVAVQSGSPAAQAGIKAGDFLDQIADPAAADPAAPSPLTHPDPIALPEVLRQMAADNRDVRLTIRSARGAAEGREPTASKVVPLRPVAWIEEPLERDDPVPAPALGIAYRVLNKVDSVAPGSPADKAGLRSGDILVRAAFVAPPDHKDAAEAKEIGKIKFDFNEKTQHSWAGLMAQMQLLPPGSGVKLTYLRGETEAVVDMTPVASQTRFLPDRGLGFTPVVRTRIAATFDEQLQRGWDETVRSLGLVYRFLQKIGDGQVPLTALGGPVTIAKAAGYSAFDGLGKLLTFLTMLSANLAVINFLPIPILDGGHMVFLAYEGVRGRPASEKFVVALHAIGFAFIVSLMAFVLALDFGLISRQL